METIALLGIDLAKNTFQLHGVTHRGKPILKRKLSRSKLIEFVANLEPCSIAMEACAGANYFSRKFQRFGHEVKLIAPQFVKPYVQGNKNDAADAKAICKAASQEDMRFVSTKETWQQDLQSIHRIRERLMKNRTALMNEIRGILYEYGLVIPKGRRSLEEKMKPLLDGKELKHDLTPMSLELAQSLYSELLELEEKIAHYENYLKQLAKTNLFCQKLLEVGGLGLISVTALLIVLGQPRHFKNGRQFSAWVGLVPRHEGTGGKNRILGMSKRGDRYLRYLLIHGARAVLQMVVRKAARGEKLDPFREWVYQLYLKRGWNKTCVALANKNARIAWALMASGENFDLHKAVQAN